MKKLLLVIFLIFSVMMTNIIVEAKTSDDFDVNEIKYVISSIDEIIFDGNGTLTKINDFSLFGKEKVYDLFLCDYGYIYSFVTTEENVNGYIIIRKVKIDGKWTPEVTEITLDESSPFIYKKNKNVYISYLEYFEYDGNNLIDTKSDNVYNYSDLITYFISKDLMLPSFSSGSDPEILYETYEYYSSSVISDVSFDAGYPILHTGYFDYDNNCSPTAGLSIIMFWDRYYPDLIELFSPVTLTLVGIPPYSYYYKYEYRLWSSFTDTEKTELRGIYNALYENMNTNNWYLFGLGPFGGTFPPDFYDALESYFSDVNLTLHHTDILNGTNTWFGGSSELTSSQWNEYKNEIDAEHPVAIFLGTDTSADYSLYYFVQPDPVRDDIPDLYTIYGTPYYYYLLTETYEYYSNTAHLVIGYGYKEVNYYKINIYGNLYLDKTDKYFIVANGWGGTSFIKNATSDISIAYSLYV